MKKGIVKMTAILLIAWSASGFAADKNGKDGLIRKPYHFNIGYNLNKFTLAGFDESEAITTNLGHGGQVAFDWQGNGRLGFQIPLVYTFHPEGEGSHEFNFGGNLMVHLTKRDKALDPYFALGLKWVGGFVNGEEEETIGAVMPYPFLNTGFGLRYMVTPSVGLFGEAAVSNFLLLAWQFEGRAGVSFGF